MNHRLYSLQEFFLSYFHPDWMLDDPTPEDVVRRCVHDTESGPDQPFRGKVVADVRDLLQRPLSEEDLHAYLLEEYSTFYDPWRDQRSTREWLESILAILTAADSVRS